MKFKILIVCLLLSSLCSRAQDINGLLPGLRYTPEQVAEALKTEPYLVKKPSSGYGTTVWFYKDVSLSFEGDMLVGWKLNGTRYKVLTRYKKGGLKVGQSIKALTRVKNAYPKNVTCTNLWYLFDYQDIYHIHVQIRDTKIKVIVCNCLKKPDINAAPDTSFYQNALEMHEEIIF